MGQLNSKRADLLEHAAQRGRQPVRLSAWQTALSIYLEDYSHRFKYGRHDCFLFAAGAIDAQTGVDVTAGVEYSSRGEAWVAIRERGRGLAEAFAAVVEPYGIRPAPVAFCRRGDPVVIRQGQRGASLGIVGLTGREIVTVTNIGLVRVPLARAFQGFQI